MTLFFKRLFNFLKKDKTYVIQRLFQELQFSLNRFKYKFPALLILNSPKPSLNSIILSDYNIKNLPLNERTRVTENADILVKKTLDLLGSGNHTFKDYFPWSTDFKTGFKWPNKYCHSYQYNDLDKNNDVKTPWELSRHQFLVQVAQAYAITKDKVYLEFIEETILDWIKTNPFAYSINWACTMDVALRTISWISINDLVGSEFSSKFKSIFDKQIYLHGIFINENIEVSDINGNHYLSDSVGLLIVGMYFDKIKWINTGLKITQDEIHNQVYQDGADFEGSIPYHRLVTELFSLAYVSVQNSKYSFSTSYLGKLAKMFSFINLYIKPDGYIPVIGDNDNGRAIILGGEDFNSHSYLLEISNHLFKTEFKNTNHNYYSTWLKSCDQIENKFYHAEENGFVSLHESGYYIHNRDGNYIFIECSPLGLGGRGGHGHNDFTSFELSLNNTPLIIDSGCYSYTSNYIERNNFRSSKYHNIVILNGVEQNDFISPENLWHLKNDITLSDINIFEDTEFSSLEVNHNGFDKISQDIKYQRTFRISNSEFILEDNLHTSEKVEQIELNIHFHHKLKVTKENNNNFLLTAGSNRFNLCISNHETMTTELAFGDISYHFGSKRKSQYLKIRIECNSNLKKEYKIITHIKGIL